MPGFPGKPMELADAERKFRGNVSRRWPTARIGTALDALWRLEAVDDVGELLGKMTA
jgi:2-methylcitrate dehydratase